MRSAGRGRMHVALAALVIVALGARLWGADRTGLGHYDEGVYAWSAHGLLRNGDPELFPGQVKFSPPLWFGAVATTARLVGAPTGRTATGLNMLVGAATVAAAGVIGTAWLGPAAGVAGAALLAGSQFHIMLDRSALTDSLFALLMLVALGALVRGVSTARTGWVVAGGILTGCAWNTKYHGWFVLLILAGALLVRAFQGRRPAAGDRRLGVVRSWILAAVIATGMYAPWALYMRTTAAGGGGWRSLLEYYLGLVGAGWLANAARHVQMQAYLDGPVSRAAVLLAAAAAVWVVNRPMSRASATALAAILVLGIWLAGSVAIFAGLAILGTVALLRSTTPLPLGPLVLLCWVGLWILAAPIYHPYARLLLPLGVAGAMLAGRGLVTLVELAAVRGPARVSSGALAMGLCLLGGLVAVGTAGSLAAAGNPWRDARGTARAAAAVRSLVPQESAIIVIGEPSLAYYLRAAGRPATALTEPITVLEDAAAEGYLVVGRYAQRAPSLREGLGRLRPRLRHLARLDLGPTDLRLLDDLSPRAARAYREQPDSSFDLHLLRLSPAPFGGQR